MPLNSSIEALRKGCQISALVTVAVVTLAHSAWGQELELPSPDLDVHGAIAAMTVKVERGSSVAETERLEFGEDGKLATAKITHADGSTTSVRYEYSRYALAKQQLTPEAFKPKKAMVFPETNTFQGVAVTGPQHSLVCDRVFDSMSASKNPLSRDICLAANGTEELNEITKLDPDDSRVSVTQLNFDVQRRASWWIQRNKQGQVLVDHLAYTDLSFDRRFHHPDGTVEERSFRSEGNEYTIKHWDASGRLVRTTRSTPGQPEFDERLSYDANGRLTHMSLVDGKAHEREFTYVNDEQGNWIEQRTTENGELVERTSREIEYRGKAKADH